MAQRHMCPSLGALRRSLAADVPVFPARSFHGSAHWREDQPPGSPAPTAPASVTRKARAETALRQINNLQARRAAVGDAARGSFSSRQPNMRRTIQPSSRPQDRPARTQVLPPTSRLPRNTAPPGAQMIRAPSKLRITRDPGRQGPPNSPNSRRREGNRGPGGAPARSTGQRSGGANPKGPEKRSKQTSEDTAGPRTANFAEIPASQTLSDGMVHNLLRLQRKEWDRVPYEPKYALNSFAANELIHLGRELFRGESPPVKVWGPLEKKIGVVGMFGAEKTLKIRRVVNDEAQPSNDEFDQESNQPVESSSELPGPHSGATIAQ